MLAVILVQPTVPALVGRLGLINLLRASSLAMTGAGLLLLVGIPQYGGLLLAGLSFGVLVVAGTNAVAEVAGDSWRGRALGLLGIAGSLGGVLGAPVGTAVHSAHWCGLIVACSGGAAALAALRDPGLSGDAPSGTEPAGASAGGGISTPKSGELLLLVVMLGATFLYSLQLAHAPVMAPGLAHTMADWIPPAAVQAALLVGRLGGGQVCDRVGRRTPLLLGATVAVLAVTTVATLVVDLGASTLLLLCLSTLLIGAVMSTTLVMLTASRARQASASVWWNLTFDVAMTIGGLAG